MRFRGFEGEWESCELGEIAEFSKGAGISKDQRSSDGNPCILYGELYTTYLTEIIDEVVSKTNLDPTGLVRSKANDIIIPASGETAIDISTARCVLQDDVLLGGDLNIIRLFNQDGRFFSYQLNGVRKKDIARIAHGVSIVHLHGNALSHITVNYPSRSEQEKISSLLSLIDQRIAIQNKVIERYRSLIQALVQQASHKSTQTVYLKEILKERKELNSQGYDVCSVSVSKGVVNQVEYLGRSFAAKETRHYNVVRHGDIVYTKSPTGDFPYGIVKQSFLDNPVAVSPLYGVYIPESYEIGVYLHYYFESAKNALNYLHKLIQKGAKNTINITNQHFLENTIKIPSAAYLTRLVSAILSVDSRIRSEESALLLYQQQKQYMLSSLFL